MVSEGKEASMRLIGLEDVEDIALGASLLGAGGGGDPYVGKLAAMAAIRECGPVTLLDADEVPDDAFVVPSAGMGAPTVLTEKGFGSNTEIQALKDNVQRFFGREVYATLPAEAGGVNSMFPLIVAARLGIPMVDADGMGRAFPELQMVTFTIGGVRTTPMAWADEKGNFGVLDTISNKWAEDVARSVTMVCGGAVSIMLFGMDGAKLKECGVHGIVTRSQQLGRAIRQTKHLAAEEGLTPEEFFLRFTGGHKLFKGKISDVLREMRGAFNYGRVKLAGIGDYKGSAAYVDFQNENLCCVVDDRMVATTPDMICLVDVETFMPVPTDALKYGKRVMVVGLECFHLWRTPEGLELAGPRYFGLDTDYIPVEERCKMAVTEGEVA